MQSKRMSSRWLIPLFFLSGCGYREMPVAELGMRNENARIATSDTSWYVNQYYISEDTLYAKTEQGPVKAPKNEVKSIKEQKGLPTWSFFLLAPIAVGIAQAFGED